MNLRIAGIIADAVAIIVVVIVLIASSDHALTQARRASCYLLRGLVHASTTNAPVQRRAAEAFIARTPLRDCNKYAESR